MQTYTNTSESWGDAVEATIEDYRAQDEINGTNHAWTEDGEHIYCDGEPVADAVTTDAQIRDHLMQREGVERVKISRDGSVHVYGNMPRGDGGQLPWWQFVGWRDEIAAKIAAESNG